MKRQGHDIEELRSLSYQEMTKGQRIAAARAGIIPPVRSERERQLRTRYGLTLEAYEELRASRNGTCWICGKTWARDLYVDHCHATNEVRGLLCASCNTLVGQIEKFGGVIRFMWRLALVYRYLGYPA
jgi:hypothetical protein